MTTQQLKMEFAQKLSGQLDNLYHEMQPFLSSSQNGKTFVVSPRGLLFQPLQSILDALNFPQIALNPQRILNGLCDCVVRTYPQDIMAAYYAMNMDGQSTDVENFDNELSTLLYGIKNPLIVSCNVDLYMLQSCGSKFLRHDNSNGEWCFGGCKRIYEMQPTAFPSSFDSVMLILSKDDAPYLDINMPYALHTTNSIQTIDQNKSMEVISMQLPNSKRLTEDYLIVLPLLPLLYNPQAKIHSLKVNIDYRKY